ncbi:MAG TPA: 16S rRNA (adenine(1518)-N(6)/adenine(1519)-N(6))-dimethyltransferase RsmA [Polyangia bacterium]|jgi:16S rRNA (adenine1518-N6/adenine1519-N6)-dimethyltransferase|nr:16S rRNA (adenine(1518)-N(6)/adenine(1519)-N(6))-dimethyltransferase RsmA [Polyangia bacterium]
MDDPRRVLARHHLDAKKSWGQNFLVDRQVLDRIVRAAAPGPDDVVVEIGAGTGALTAALAAQAPAVRRIVAVERDPDMLRVLHAELGSQAIVEVRAADAAAFDFAAESAAAGRPLVVLGNLPYQIASALLLALAGAGVAVARAIVMVQKEMAQRVVAPPGSKTYGRLSVMVQQRTAARILFHVGPGAFHPRPKVTSSVMALVPRATPLAPVADLAAFERLVKEAFSTRRKMLRRALEPAYGAAALALAFERAGIAGTRRAEELAVADFARLSDALGGVGNPHA